MDTNPSTARWTMMLNRPVVAAAVLLVVYALLSLMNSTGGYLGTDTGAKAATIAQMSEDETWRPEVGYWAEEWDPGGDFHPLFQTGRNDEGGWTNVTTLPMLLAARPLYDIGGYRLALLLPMLGSVAAAFGSRDLARLVGGPDRTGWRTFWIVGLASPMTIYALDLWEHSIGAALMLWSLGLLIRAIWRSERASMFAAGAGFLLGSAATMRTESLAVAAAFTGGAVLHLLLQRRVRRAVSLGVAVVAGFAVPWLLNAWSESALGGLSRGSRVAGIAQARWWDQAADRGSEALITWFRLPNLDHPGDVVLGATAVVCILAAMAVSRSRPDRLPGLLLAGAAACLLVAFAGGLAFVSGALVASPFAVGAVLGLRLRPEASFAGSVALSATILTWTFQYTGGALPQWGGRYILAPTLVLTTIGIVAALASPRYVTVAVAGLSLAVTMFGLLWVRERTHDFDHFFSEVAAAANEHGDVVISDNGFLVREAGPAYRDARYLSVGVGVNVHGAVALAEEAGAETVAVLTLEGQVPDLRGTYVETIQFDVLGVPFHYYRYRLA